jgi:hypothetical protein
MTSDRIFKWLVVVAVLGVSCAREPLRVTTIQIGRSLNGDGSVAAHTTRFAPNDTMYASVLTDARGSGTIAARWVYSGRVLNESMKDVSYDGPAATEFHFQAADGFPPGDYTVEILVDGQSAGMRQMRVER